jgi:hypothetical protein
MASPPTKPKSKRRWAQVSLRTVLVLVTLLCVALSLWVVPAERQRRAVAAAIISLTSRCWQALVPSVAPQLQGLNPNDEARWGNSQFVRMRGERRPAALSKNVETGPPSSVILMDTSFR